MTNLVLLSLLFLAMGIANGTAVRIQIVSSQTKSESPLVTAKVTCSVGGQFDVSLQAIQDISIVGPDRTEVLARVTTSKMSDHANTVSTANIMAHGSINNYEIDRSFLTLTLRPVLRADNGLYTCHVHYREGAISKLETAQQVLNVTDQDEDAVTKYLLSKISTLTTDIEKKDLELEKQNEFIVEQGNFLKDLEKKVAANKDGLKSVQAIAQKQKAEIEAVDGRAKYLVAFHARYKYKYTFVTGDVLKFGLVDLNIGNGYNGKTGVFTAPMTGIYTFHLTVNYPFHDRGFAVNIVANGKAIAAAYSYDNDYDNSGSTSAMVKLEKGQKVTPKIRDVTGRKNLDNNGEYSVFNGHLVKLV